MKNRKTEENVIIAINAMKKVMIIFLGPFLTTYFIKKSQESILDLSTYYIFSYILLGIGTFIVASIVKNKFRIGMFRIGVILNFVYIIAIITLKEKIIEHLGLISILYGISSSAYWFSYNLFAINKIDNKTRTEYTVKSKIISSIIGILCPIILGSIITVTNYELTAVIILIISVIQIILSFMLSPDKETNLCKFNIKETWNKLKNNKQIRKISMISVKLYGKIYKKKDDKNLIIISSIFPVIAVLILLIWRNNVTIIIYNVCYVVFTSLLTLTREIRLFNISDSHIVDKNNQCEFFALREGILNIGRVVGYVMLLLAGLTGNTVILSIVMFLLTLSILAMGLNIAKIEKFEE